MRLATVATLALACLAGGCVTLNSPLTVRADGQRSEHTLQLPPQRAAGCLSRNADEYIDTLVSNVRALPDGKRHEVVVRQDVGGGYTTMAVIEVSPNGSGSRATVWNTLTMESQRAEFLQRLVRGC